MPNPDDVAEAIARNARQFRADRQWSLEHLATRAGISKGMLVQIEQARTNPSIATLCRLADAFGVNLASLVELSAGSSVRVVDHDEIARLWTGAEGSFGDLMVGTERSEHVELWRWSLAAGDSHDSDGHVAGTRELLAVLAGTLTLETEGQSHIVRSGGAVLFEAEGPHRYINAHKRNLDLVLVVVQPPVEPGTGPSHPD